MQQPSEKPVKSGMVTLVGPPNVGKSTLLNSLLGQKISIVSPKPQTTRNRILGIVNGDDYQIVMLDTPGIHDTKKPLNLEMVRIALSTLTEADVILFMIDVTLPLPKPETAPVRHLKDAGRPAMLVINKIDLVGKDALLPIIAAYQKLYPFTAIIPVSAKLGDGTERIIGEIRRLLPEGPRLYPEDIPTDATERFIVAEIIREKIFLKTGEEVPYATAVVVDSFKEDPARMQVVIHATIFVEKQSQKGIVIGKNGRKLKEIGTAAREDMESLLGLKVVLKLWVKVHKDWTRDSRFLKEFGFGGIS